METASIVASFVSMILGGVAIWLSVHFYTQAKNTESRVEIALEGIKTQTDALQRIIGRTLDRFTKFVTSPRETASAEAAQILQSAIRDLPMLTQHAQQSNPQSIDPAVRARLLELYIAGLNYTAQTNFWAAMMLPAPDAFDRENTFHVLTQEVIDRSYNDFQFFLSVVNNVDPNEIAASPVAHLYEEATNSLRPLICDTAGHFVRISNPQSG